MDGGQAARENHHISIWDALARMQDSIDKVGRFRDRIKIGPQDKNPSSDAPEPPAPSLKDVLESTSQRIMSMRTELEDYLSDIDGSLF